MFTVRKTFALLDHMPREVYRIKPLDTLYEISCDRTRATANVENVPWLSVDESRQDIEDLSRIGRTITIGLHDTLVLKWLSVFSCPLVWFVKHLCQIPPHEDIAIEGNSLSCLKHHA
jgi:hypothetical protein